MKQRIEPLSQLARPIHNYDFDFIRFLITSTANIFRKADGLIICSLGAFATREYLICARAHGSCKIDGPK